VAAVITIDPARVKWRGDGNRRHWLAGTAIDHTCAILDVREFAAMLTSDEVGVAK
jgi:purine-binding chemotaxis protein CheW